MTGDLPTPVKYFNNSIHGEYEKLEKLAVEKIADTPAARAQKKSSIPICRQRSIRMSLPLCQSRR